MTRREKGDHLREACIQEAMRIIETSGIEQLSMREVARRLGVSHQAPYKHFPSRDHILAEIVKRCFEDFARHLDAQSHAGDAHARLHAMGYAYLRYAAEHPLQYRLMFGTPLPDPEHHPEMMDKALHAFSILRSAVAEMMPSANPAADALYVWSTMHGLASLLQLQMVDKLSLHSQSLDDTIRHIIEHIGTGLLAGKPTDPGG
jgi:AcrR family transcriptional regulator